MVVEVRAVGKLGELGKGGINRGIRIQLGVLVVTCHSLT